MTARQRVLELIEQSHKALCSEEIAEQLRLKTKNVQNAVTDLLEDLQIKVVRIDDEGYGAAWYRPIHYRFINRWLEGWAGAPELGLTKWFEDKAVKAFMEMICQRDYSTVD